MENDKDSHLSKRDASGDERQHMNDSLHMQSPARALATGCDIHPQGERTHGATFTLHLTLPDIYPGSSRIQEDPNLLRTSCLRKLCACSHTHRSGRLPTMQRLRSGTAGVAEMATAVQYHLKHTGGVSASRLNC